MTQNEIQKHIKVLGDDNEEVREAAGDALVAMGKSSVPALIEALKDKRWSVRKAVIKALGGVGSDASDAVPALIDVLKDGRWFVRKAVIEALGEICDQAAVPALIKVVKVKIENERIAAVEALGKIGPDATDAVPALIRALTSEGGKLSKAVASALGKIGDEAAVPALIKLLNDDWAGKAVAKALRDIAPHIKKALPHLIKALKHPDFQEGDWLVALGAERALTKVGAPAVPPLIKALKDKNFGIVGRAASTLGWIGPEASAAVPALTKVLTHDESEVRYSAAEALGKIGEQGAVPALTKALKDNNEYVRRAAADALGKIGD